MAKVVRLAERIGVKTEDGGRLETARVLLGIADLLRAGKIGGLAIAGHDSEGNLIPGIYLAPGADPVRLLGDLSMVEDRLLDQIKSRSNRGPIGGQ